MLRLAILLAVLVLSAGAAWAEPGTPTPSPTMPGEFAWVKDIIDFMQAAGPWGFSGFLLYLMKIQRDERDKESTELKAALKGEQDYSRKTQDDRIVAAGASADRIATTAVSGTAAIVASQEAVGRLVTKLESIEKLVTPLPVEHATIIRNQEGLLTAVSGIATKVGTGCRAS